MTMTLVSTVTVGAGGAASIEFTGIPQTGTDLLVVFSVRSFDGSITYFDIRFNGDAGANYSNRSLYGTGTTAYSDIESGSSIFAIASVTPSTATANTFGNGSFYVPNYAGASAKSLSFDNVTENNATAAYQNITAGLWNSTAAITSVKIFPNASTFAQYSTASLYLITKGSGGASVA